MNRIKQAFILAAGLGLRMKPVTDHIPKPMIEINGKSIILRTINQLISYGIEKIVINSFYKADQLKEHIEKYIKEKDITTDILIIEEPELLDSGGGIINALPYLNNEPFFAVNGDAIWVGKQNPFSFLNQHWENKMKALFLLTEHDKAFGYEGDGDFDLDKNQMLMRLENRPRKYIYISAQITRPEIFTGYHGKQKWMNIYSKFIDNNVYQDFYGIAYDGYWFHISTPKEIKITEDKFKELGTS